MLFNLLKSLLRSERGTAPAAAPPRPPDPPAAEDRLKRAAKLHRDGDLDAARALYESVLEAAPQNAEAHHLMGLLELYRGNHESAERSLRRATEIDPGNAFYLDNLGLALEYQGRLPEAIACSARVLDLDPRNAEAHSRMGTLLLAARRIGEAAASFRRAVELAPAVAKFRFNLSFALLLAGEYAEGWREYEFRWDGSPDAAGLRRDFREPQWRGEPLAGRTLLLHAEQAFGDTLQFVRYAGLAVDRGDAGRVILECQPELAALCASVREGLEVIARGSPLPPFDVHCPLLSLPLAFGTTLDSIPAAVPYLRADARKSAQWAGRLRRPAAQFRVGLVWSGKLRRMNRWHNLEVSDLAPLLALRDARYLSLQKGATGAAPEPGAQPLPFEDYTAELDDFSDTAALVANLDLVISVDTSVAHLAGAMGRPVWLLARFDADWRWLADRDDSPWYPSMRIFRQPAPGAWNEVLARVVRELEQVIRGGGARLTPR